jgi:hypothetical protein
LLLLLLLKEKKTESSGIVDDSLNTDYDFDVDAGFTGDVNDRTD